MPKNRNPNQLSFDFSTPTKIELEKENLDYCLRLELSAQLKHWQNINNCDRWDLATALSKILNKDIGKNTIDSWTSPAREDHKFPLSYLPAICQILGSNDLLKFIAKYCECTILEGEEAEFAQLGQISRSIKFLQEKQKELRSKGVQDE